MIHDSLNLVQVIADPTHSGGPVHVLALVEGIRKLRPDWQLTVVTTEGWLADQLPQGVAVVKLPLPGRWGALDRSVADQLRSMIEELSQSHQPTLVHLHGVRAGILGLRALADLDIPIIYTEHRWDGDYQTPQLWRGWLQLHFLRRLGQRVQKIICVSEAVRSFLMVKRIGRPDQLVVIHHGLPISENGEQKTENREKGIEKRGQLGYRLGAVGNLVSVKGFDVVIKAIPLILQNFPQTTLEIIGDGPERSYLERLARSLGLTQAIRFLASDDPKERFGHWQLFVSASRAETFGLAIAEAMQAGLPVVATKVGGVPELVTAEVGRLVPANDPHELAKAIIDLLPKAQERARLGKAAQERIKTDFSLEQMIEKTVHVYEDALNGKSK